MLASVIRRTAVYLNKRVNVPAAVEGVSVAFVVMSGDVSIRLILVRWFHNLQQKNCQLAHADDGLLGMVLVSGITRRVLSHWAD